MTRKELRALYSEEKRRIRDAEIAATVDWISEIMVIAATEGKLRCQINILTTPVLAQNRRAVIEGLQARFSDVTFWISSGASFLLIDWA